MDGEKHGNKDIFMLYSISSAIQIPVGTCILFFENAFCLDFFSI